MIKIKRCSECKDGEHENYDNNVITMKIYYENKYITRKNLCESHRDAMRTNDYILKR